MAKKKTAVEQMDALFQKVEEIKGKFTGAVVKAEAEVEQLKLEIATGEAELKELYTSYVLDEVTLSTYQHEQKVLADKRSVLTVAEGKVSNIDKILKEELYKVYQDMQKIGNEFNAENGKNKADQRKKTFQAKVTYLKAIREAKVEVEKTNVFERKLDHLKVEIGLKDNPSYDMYDSAVSAMVFNSYNNAPGVDVRVEEIKDAYHKGLISAGVLKEAE